MTTLARDVAGTSGPPVLLLHSGATDRLMWAPQWDALAADHRVARVDLPGFGETPAVTAGTSDDVAAVDAVLAELGWHDVTVVGSSYGGYVALGAAATSTRVGRLVLVCALTPQLEPDADLRAVWEAERALVEEDDLDAAVDLMVRTWVGPRADRGTRAAVAAMQRGAYRLQAQVEDAAVEEVEHEVDVALLAQPTTVVVGLQDVPCFAAAGRATAAAMPNARLVELDWAGHLPSMEDPAAFEPVLREALTWAPGER